MLLTACQSATETEADAVYEPMRFTQLEPPQPGDPIAIVHTNMGDITIRLFPQYAPMTVENFIAQVENGFYDDSLFYRAVPEFVIQAGRPETSETIWGRGFDPEYDTPLHHIRGAVGASRLMGLSTSDFYIVQNSNIDHETEISDQFREIIAYPYTIMTDMWDAPFIASERIPIPFLEHYLEHGGMWRLDYPGLGTNIQQLAIFGQVISGMEVVDAISRLETTGPEGTPPNVPLEEVVITAITLGEY